MSVSQPTPPDPLQYSESPLLQLPVEVSDEIYKLVICPATLHLIAQSPYWRDNRDYGKQSHFYCANPTPDFCGVKPEVCWGVMKEKYPHEERVPGGQKYPPRADISLLSTCRQILAQVHHYFYTNTTFSIAPMVRIELVPDLYATVHKLGSFFLQQIGAPARGYITCLFIGPLGPWKGNFGSVIPPREDERQHEYDLKGTEPFQTEVDRLCLALEGMTGLQHLELTISGGNLYLWTEVARPWTQDDAFWEDGKKFQDVPWVRPLLRLCRPQGIGAVIWLKDEHVTGFLRPKDVVSAMERLLIPLAKEMMRRRLSSEGIGPRGGRSSACDVFLPTTQAIAYTQRTFRCR